MSPLYKGLSIGEGGRGMHFNNLRFEKAKVILIRGFSIAVFCFTIEYFLTKKLVKDL